MKNLRELSIWEKGHQLTLMIYQISASFPKEELYGLTSQIRRSSASIPANIAEGCGRFGDAEFTRFLQIAMGSASETEYHIRLARDLKYLSVLDHQRLENQVTEIKRMLSSFIEKVKKRSAIRGLGSSRRNAERVLPDR